MTEISPIGQVKNPNNGITHLDLNATIGHYATAEYPEDEVIQQVAYTITPAQRTYCALRARGFSSAAACRRLNINQMAAQRWTTKEWFDPVCEEERIKWLQSEGIDTKKEVLLPLMGPAVNALKDALVSDDEKIRLAAVNLVFSGFLDEKNPVGRPRKRKEHDSEAPQDFSDIMARSAAKIEQLRNGQANIIDIRANA